jgi:endonuclease-3
MQDKLRKIYEKLLIHCGKPSLPEGDPLEVLIKTVLSQNTNDRNRDLAFERLKESFSHWEALLEASEEELSECLRPAGLNRQKARWIKGILEKIKEKFGKLDLSGLGEMGKEEALSWLLNIKGIGMKTAHCVLAFGFGQDVFPVDTHILRISKRLGLLPPQVDLQKAHEVLSKLVPKGIGRELHVLLIRYGQKVCKARNPLCQHCLFPEECLYHRKADGGKGD